MRADVGPLTRQEHPRALVAAYFDNQRLDLRLVMPSRREKRHDARPCRLEEDSEELRRGGVADGVHKCEAEQSARVAVVLVVTLDGGERDGFGGGGEGEEEVGGRLRVGEFTDEGAALPCEGGGRDEDVGAEAVAAAETVSYKF